MQNIWSHSTSLAIYDFAKDTDKGTYKCAYKVKLYFWGPVGELHQLYFFRNFTL